MSLIETAFSITAQALTAATLVQQVVVVALITEIGGGWISGASAANHVGRLVATVRNLSSASADVSPPVAMIAGESITFHADLDNNGRIDTRSSEAIRLYVTRTRRRARLVHRIGRQSMTIAEGPTEEFYLKILDRYGLPTSSPAHAALLRVGWTDPHQSSRQAWFALPPPLP